MATIAEQLAGMAVTDTLKRTTLPAFFSQLPWAASSGTWSETSGWNPPGWAEGSPGGSRGGIYWNTEKIKGGNGATSVKWGSIAGGLLNLRQFSTWLFSEAGGTASGYQLVAWQTGATNQFTFKLRKWVAGGETLLGETLEVSMEIGGAFAVVAFGGKVSAWVKKNEAAAWVLVGSEVADTTFTEGFSGIDGNGSNPKLLNFSTGKLSGATPVELAATSGASSTSMALSATTTIPLAPTGGGSSTTIALKAKTGIPLQSTKGVASTSLAMRVKQKAVRLPRQAPPMRLYLLATAPSGRVYRWGEDEPGAADVFGDLIDSDSVPGGYKELQCSLARKPGVDYADMAMGTHLELFGAGQAKVGEYRLERAPRSSGDHLSMDPAAYGYQGHLADDETAQEIFLDSDLSSWGEPSVARRLYLWANGIHISAATTVGRSPLQKTDTAAGVINDFTGTTNLNQSAGEADYYGGGVDIGQVRYDYRQLSTYAEEAAWESNVALSALDTFLTFQVGVDHHRATKLQQALIASGSGMKFARLRDKINNAGYTGQLGDVVAWQNIKVLGRHGLSLVGVWPAVGLLASAIIAYALGRWAPLIQFTTGPSGTIRPTSFSIPHLVFKDPGPISDWIAQANRFELNEWAVWNDRTFYLNPRGTREGRKRWVARVAPARLQETGQQMERVWNGVVVQYRDVGGETRSVGPPGSTATFTDARLLDDDPLNIANQIPGLRRWTRVETNGLCSPEGAIRIGELFLAQTKELDGAGSATLTGYVEDENGRLWPYYCVHSGDLIRFPDASRPGWRYIVNAQRSRAGRSVDIDLDAPPDSMAALLERLDVVLVPLAVS